ncbi:hypothetical protein V1264_019547 [Littorina saxatilis]|uniref:Uncharacterized protein n=1 Tax=Littorina saxatilis TaxID=31220 RepID=A0AAN9BEW3_9CAEN
MGITLRDPMTAYDHAYIISLSFLGFLRTKGPFHYACALVLPTTLLYLKKKEFGEKYVIQDDMVQPFEPSLLT